MVANFLKCLIIFFVFLLFKLSFFNKMFYFAVKIGGQFYEKLANDLTCQRLVKELISLDDKMWLPQK